MRFPCLYAVVDQETAEEHGWQVPELARAYLAGGAQLLQIRACAASSGTLLAWCEDIVMISQSYDAKVIVNDRSDVAHLAEAAGVHVGQDDLSVETIRRLLPAEALVGLSTHTREQVERAIDQPISYVAVGPVLETVTKVTSYQPVGFELVSFAARAAPSRPVVAIGGVTLEATPYLITAGASAVAVISDLLVGSDPERRVRDYVEMLEDLTK